ncbi:MAG TPA: phage holin family protein [Candidatus Saccharimonadales bacterium]|jgi:putative membrane protein|nr:phage holin family protein [Candidatus Saccharimonadales bacterium]
MKQGPILRFLVYWIVCGLGIWVATFLLHQQINYSNQFTVIVVSGFILALVNLVVKPIVILLSFPAILLTLGLFMVIINALMLILVSLIYPSLHISSFTTALLAGMVIGLVNYIVSRILDKK